ncbi:MAG: carboxypeptidase-like regulatory domain-containing protein, partial [Planctomycetota bacterium]|nr:carboxypeptidase-like regulatory domain-containing protein [Planctomycetota bacterium]
MSPRARIFVSLVVVALGCGVWWWLGARQQVAPPVSGGGEVAAASADTPSGEASVSAGEAVVIERAEAAPPSAQAGGRPLVVQVWLGDVGVPAAGAEVFVMQQRGAASPPDVEGRGARFVADAAGRAALPPVSGVVAIAARLPGVFGARSVAADESGEVALTLLPDQTVTVRVVDASDAPVAGALVALNQRVPVVVGMEWAFEELAALEREMAALTEQIRQSTAEDVRKERAPELRQMKIEYGRLKRRASGRRGGRGASPRGEAPEFAVVREELARRRTDARGLAVFRHFQLLQRRDDPSWPEARRGRFEVALSAPLAEPVAEEFSSEAVPDDVLVLRAPAGGTMTMRTVDADGRPFLHPVHVELFQVDEQGDTVGEGVKASKAQGAAALGLPFVGVDLAVEGHFHLDDESFHWVERLPAVREEGDHLDFDVVVAPEGGMLRGVVAGEGGAEVDFAVQAGPVQVEVERLQLNDDGGFHLPYRRAPELEAPFRLQLRRDGEPVEGGVFPFARLPVEGVLDVGALQIGALEPLAVGVVVDDLGAAVAGAVVQLQRQAATGPLRGGMEFRDEAAARVETDADGRFTVFGVRERGRSRLFVKAQDHFPAETADLRPGDDAVRVELLRKGVLAGVVLVPEWMHPGYVRVELLPQHVPSLPPGGAAERLGRIEGELLAFDWLRAGTYSLTFAMRGFREPFLRLEDLVVAAGANGLHPDLNGLDLSRYIHRFEISAVDENGDPVVADRPMLARITHADNTRSWMGLPVRGSASQVFSATPQLEVFPTASGYVADPQVLSPGPNEVLYRRVPPVEVALPGLYALGQGVEVYVALEQLDRGALPASLGEGFDNISNRMSAWYEQSRFSAAELQSDDIARFVLPGGGPHKVGLRVSLADGAPQFVE